MKIKQNISIFASFIILTGFCSVSHAFSDKTHKVISEKAVTYSQVDSYLKNELGFSQGLGAMLLLDQSVIPVPERIPSTQFENRINPELSSNPCSILNFLKAGANLEDVPKPRARHHFHAPIANPGVTPPNPNSGLDNKTDHPDWAAFFDEITYFWYTLHFDLTGASAQKRALGIEGAEWETEYLNYFAWPDTRTYFYRALTKSTLAGRNHYLALTFISLGQTIHLLEDMGVPAHTRNDFVYGHMALMGITPATWGKNPFENWAEKQVKTNNGNIPSSWLIGVGSNIPAFSSLKKYWDTDTYTGQYVGTTTPNSWGLCERTNYQFLSFSTMFRTGGSLYAFPHPAKANAPVGSEFVNGKKRYYRSGYDVPHLTRVTYTTYISGFYGIPVTYEEDAVEEEMVFNDYAQRTIPRTINYATGLINYFFRGRLSVESNCTNAECDPIEIYIANQSVNTNVEQTLKGGSFELYWDDNVGNRTLISGLIVYDSNDPNRTVLWSTSTTLPKGNSVRAKFDKPSSSNIDKYILVYRGSISANPNDPDPNDPNAIAVCEFAPPNPPQPQITNIAPEMGCPGSILYIEGSGFSKTPSYNTVLFDDVITGHPNVYGIVQQADSNGQWLKVELPTFDAEDEEFYWVNTIVTADGNTSAPYVFKLTNYVWCTIWVFDAGEDIDDEFDLYINDEYITTSYMDPPEDPTVVDVGFWYEDVYDYVDVYLYESYGTPGGTLGIIIEPYVNRVIAYRWNSSSQSQEFLYDQDYFGLFYDYFSSDVLVEPDDGAELDVYAFPTYTGSLGSLMATPLKTIKRKSNTISADHKFEQPRPFDPAGVAENKGLDIPKKRARKITGHNRTRNKVEIRQRVN